MLVFTFLATILVQASYASHGSQMLTTFRSKALNSAQKIRDRTMTPSKKHGNLKHVGKVGGVVVVGSDPKGG